MRDELGVGFNDEARTCPITGKKEKKTLKSVLNKKGKINKHELDDLFAPPEDTGEVFLDDF